MKDMNEINEPPLRGPWPAWAVAGLILGSYGLQLLWLGDVNQASDRFGLIAPDLGHGRWFTLITSLFIHGGWAHAGMNAAGALAFGAPVARILGKHGRWSLSYFGFFLTCGLLSGLGYALFNLHSPAAVIGASGAVSGLFGGASRLIEHRPGLSPFASRTVAAFGAAWVVINLVFGLIGFAPGLGAVQIAWQAHLIGYLAGLLLIGPWARFLSPPDSAWRSA